jgi:hypothetical protein
LLAGSIAALLMGGPLAMAHDDDDDDDDKAVNIVTAVVPPPVVANGIIAGEPTEIIVLLNVPEAPEGLAADPNFFGHQIPAGGRLEIELGGTFERNGVDNGDAFVPVNSNAFAILVTGLPQGPITMPAGDGVQHGNYTIVDDGNKIISYVPNGGSGDNGLEQARANEIGVKVVHIRPRPNTNVGPAPFTNGAPGTEGTVAIRIFNSENEIVEQGHGSVMFPAAGGRVVGPTNIGLATGGQGSPATVTTELVESVTFQHVAKRTVLENTVRPAGGSFSDGAPYAPRFVLFEKQAMQPDSFIPFKGIAGVGYIVDQDDPNEADVVEDSNGNGVADEGDTKIGKIEMDGPKKSNGTILPSPGLTTSGDGVTGPNGSIFNVPVQVGNKKGVYTVTVSLDDGNRATTTLIVE